MEERKGRGKYKKRIGGKGKAKNNSDEIVLLVLIVRTEKSLNCRIKKNRKGLYITNLTYLSDI